MPSIIDEIIEAVEQPGLPAGLKNLEKPGISLCDLGNLENQGNVFENLENIFFDMEVSF